MAMSDTDRKRKQRATGLDVSLILKDRAAIKEWRRLVRKHKTQRLALEWLLTGEAK